MSGLLENKVVVITGAGSGVGRAATLLFAQHGAKVIAADINAASAEESVAQAKAAGGTAIAAACDVSNEAAVQNLVKLAVETFGRLDVIYNNAGITLSPKPPARRTRILDATPDDIARLQGVNINGVLFGCQAAIRQFETQGGGGIIVNTASVAGLIGWGGSVYGATKGAIVNLTRTLALEVSAQGIRVNSVCPGGMLTHFAGLRPDHPQAEQILKGLGARHPLGRAIDPMDVAKAALFLSSDLASNITGVNLPVDGGLSAGVLER
jgi:NAD(P)-dependent dehydrogenase (short-subunit alcohol dehydrogenase family)